MSYRKFTADQLFTGYEMFGEKMVLITDENGIVEEIISSEMAGDGVERLRGIISPGFINCHCHLELSHMLGVIPEHTGMVAFLLTVMGNRNSDTYSIQEAIRNAEAEMLSNGIVAVGDICNTDQSILQKKKGRLYYRNFIEAMGVVEQAAEARFTQAGQLYEQFQELQQPVTIVPHAPYSVSPALLSMINAHHPEALLTLHNQESEAENELFVKGTGDFLDLYKAMSIGLEWVKPSGESSIRTVLPYFSAGHSMLLVHNVATSRNDLAWIGQNKSVFPELFWCLCPNANKYITGHLPDIKMFKEFGEKMVVGTDSLASNRELNILSELKMLQLHFPELKTDELLLWATSNGARALGIQERFGSLEKGKKPGIVLIEGPGENGSLKNASCRVLL